MLSFLSLSLLSPFLCRVSSPDRKPRSSSLAEVDSSPLPIPSHQRKSIMTQEGQALPESPVEPDAAATTGAADPPAETHSQAETEKLGAKDDSEEGEQQDIRRGEEEAQGETHGEGREDVKDEGGEGELEEESAGGERRADGGAEGERGGARGGVRINEEVSSAGEEEATHEEEGMEEEEEGKESEEMQPSAEEEAAHPEPAGRSVH